MGTTLVNQTTVSYDDTARVVTTATDKDANLDGLLQSQTKFDGLGRVWRAASKHSSGQWSITDTAHDALGRVEKVSNPYLAVDTNGTTLNPPGLWTTSTFDALSRVINVKTPDNAQLTTVYSGNTVTVTDQANKSRKSETDALGRLVKVWEDPGSTPKLNYLTSYEYDALDNLKKVTSDTQTRTFNYDSLKRLTSASNPESGTVNYEYDPNENLTKKTDARGIFIQYDYDALNRNISVDYSNTNLGVPDITRVYDNPNSGAYGLGRLWYDFANGDDTHGANVEYKDIGSYDALGRPLSVNQWFKHNSDWGTNIFTTQQTYNLAGQVKTITYPSGRTVTMNYDNAGCLSEFKGTLGDGTLRNYAGNTTEPLQYSAAGQLIKERFGTNTPLYHQMYFNNRQQLYNIQLGTNTTSDINEGVNKNRGELRLYYNADYLPNSGAQNNGNLYRAEHFVPLNDSVTSYIDSVSYYNYDALNRLVSVDELPIAYWVNPAEGWLPQSYSQRYKYDRWGNRQLNVVATWGIGINRKDFGKNDTNNRLTAPVGQSGMMTYDAAGNLTFDNYSTPIPQCYEYDAENRLKNVKLNNCSNAVTHTYTYEADGKRTRRNVNGVETWLIYGLGSELVAEYPVGGTSNAPQKEYGYRGGQLLVIYDATESGDKRWQWLVTDHLGTPRMIADLSGSLTGMKRHDYLPFGEEIKAGTGVRDASYGYATDKVRQKFTGYERDDETGLDFAQSRYYSSTQGRFTKPDVFGGRLTNPQTLNLYAYVLNNPLKWNDPSGHMAQEPKNPRKIGKASVEKPMIVILQNTK
ncbi:MAG: RHS repeat-associated core domain-containing protein [Acidobacteria bacterium]|nr:RHS repeat-associated core domain-containing protein [Acidobacteriota bacterium]